MRHIVEVAAALFTGQGYAATSIEQVATAAGAGKQTLYRRFGSKEALFIAVIDQQSQRLLAKAAAVEMADVSPLEALKEVCRQLFDFSQDRDTIRLHRTLVAEAGRFPDLGDHLLNDCLAPFQALLVQLLQAAMDQGQMRRMDAEMVRAMLSSLVTGWPVLQALLGRCAFANGAERDAYFEAAWDLFLNGVR
jgi:AcrR family transcriptional regulator